MPGILKREHLDLEEKAQKRLIVLVRQNSPKAQKQIVPGAPVLRIVEHLKRILEARLNLLHDLSDKSFFRSKVMEQHSGARPEVGRERSQ